MLEDNNDYTQISTEILIRLGAIRDVPTKKQIIIKCLSPDHEDKHASMSVSLDKGLCHCFSCGYSARLTTVYYNATGHSIYRDLGISRNAFVSLASFGKHDDSSLADLPETDFVLEGDLVSLSEAEAGVRWAQSRGFTPEYCDLNGMKFGYSFSVCQKSDRSEKRSYYNCAVIPIFEKGTLLSFEARNALSKEDWLKKQTEKGKAPDEKLYKKVLYPPHSSINTLYQYERLDENDTLYVTEGLMDMFSLRTSKTFKNSSCMFHCNPTERQIFLLKKFKHIVYVVDNDLPGLSACRKMMDKLPGKVSYLQPPVRTGVKDVNDILQGKDKVLKTVDDLLDRGWLKKTSSDIDALDFIIAEKRAALE